MLPTDPFITNTESGNKTATALTTSLLSRLFESRAGIRDGQFRRLAETEEVGIEFDGLTRGHQ